MVFGLVGIVSTISIGVLILKPLSERVARLDMSGGVPPEAEALSLKLIRGAQADFTVLFVVVWAMVAKPAWDQPGQLAAMLAVIAMGGLWFLRPR